MTKTTRKALLITSVTGLLAASAIATFADDRRGDGPRGMMQTLMSVDADKDGALTNAEVTAFAAEKFSEADANGDGAVTAAEISEVMQGRRGGRAQHVLVRFDVDANGSVSEAEMNDRVAKLFAWMDIDSSGAIEGDEMPVRGGKGRGHGGRN